MAQMTFYIYKGAKFLGRPIKRDAKGQPTERYKFSDDGSPAKEPIHGVGICVVGQSYDINEWVARAEGELFDLKGAKKETLTRNMDGEEDLPEGKVTEAMIDLGMVKGKKRPAEEKAQKAKADRVRELDKMKVAELEEIMAKHKIPLDSATNNDGRVEAIVAVEFPTK